MEEHRFLQFLIDAVPHPIFYKNKEGKFVGCNVAYESYAGVSRDKIIGYTVRDLYPEDIVEIIEKKDKELYEKDGVQTYELSSETNYVVTKSLYRSSDGRQLGLVGVLTDITEVKRAQEIVRASEAYFNSFTESSQDCIAHISLDGKYLSMNPAGCEILQFEVCGKAIGMDFTAAIMENRTVVEEALKKAAAGETMSVRYECLGQRNKKLWWDAKLSPVTDFDGSIKSILLVARDISEQKKLEEQLQEAQEAEKRVLTEKNQELEKAYSELKTAQTHIFQQEKMASIGQLAAGVAHEINNPVGFVMSNLGSLKKYVDRLTGYIAEQARALEAISQGTETSSAVLQRLEESRRSLKIEHITSDVNSLIDESLDGATRVKKIVQAFKSFSHVDEAEVQMADLNECLESTINIVWNELKYKAALKKEFGELPKTLCNPGQLNQVFVNLLINAAHAIEKHGEITVRTWRDNGTVNVSVQDTGCGIAPDNLRKIFEPFFTTKEIGKGTGLGLSIAYDIIKKHNGSMRVDSVVGAGTTFTITLPVVEKEQ